MTQPGIVHVVLPNDIDDPSSPSGGNTYDRRLCRGLAEAGWSVREHGVPGAWPRPGRADRANLAAVLSGLPDDAVVLLDGLVASAVPEVLVPEAARLRLVVLVHLPLGEDSGPARDGERDVLAGAAAIVATSAWSRLRLLDLYGLPGDRVHTAAPGVDAAPLIPGSSAGTELLCVATVTPGKGHDVLLAALATIVDQPWHCVCVGPLDRDPAFVERVLRQAAESGLAGRVDFVGPRTGADLADSYAAADLFVLASHGETYGMVVTEALARGTPVLATAAKGLPEAVGRAPAGGRPGLLVPPNNPAALAVALRRWWAEPDLRRDLRRSARERRSALTSWSATAALVSAVLGSARSTAGASR